MSRGVNKAIIIGNVGQDPETRFTPSGDAVANISVATDESYKDKQSGQIVPRTEWHRCTAYGKLAEVIGQYVRKGSKLYVEGRLATRKWTDQGGVDRYTTEIKISEMQMLDSKPEGQQQAPQQRQPAPQQRPVQQPAPQPQGGDVFDDDIPFSQFERNTVA